MITITLKIQDQNPEDGPKTTEIDCSVTHDQPTNSEAVISNIINTAARVAFEDHLRANPGGGHIVQRAKKGGPNERGIRPKGL
jgi:hypothetical protein